MAARKSCTHLTWAEAKTKVGGSSAKSKKKAQPSKKLAHNQILAQKIISKNNDDGLLGRSAIRRAEREDAKASAAIAAAKKEAELERLNRVMEPFELSRSRMRAMAQEVQQVPLKVDHANGMSSTCKDDMEQIALCKQMQSDELMALEAIFAETDEFLISEASELDVLREKLDLFHDDETNEKTFRALVQHPQLVFSIQLTIDDHRPKQPESHGMDLVACVLVQVTLPALYPHSTTPQFDFLYSMITDRYAPACSIDKTLESLAHLDEIKIKESLLQQATEMLPDCPCVYEVGVTWLSENLFDYIEMRTHAVVST